MIELRLLFYFTSIFALLHLKICHCISIDNSIIGDPDIECLDEEIRVWVKTRKTFAGRIYAKGRADNPDCYKDDFARDRTVKPHFDLKFGICGMKSLRSVDPRGMYYGITLVVSFHPLFITKVDQAYHVKCFFEEASRGLTAEIGVSMIPTTEVEAKHTIPGCTYSIHRSSIEDLDAGKAAGAAIQFARVGDKVLHQWHCDDQMFGILINKCYVTDGFGKRSDVIDAKGCPVDPILITGIRYSPDTQRAYAESQVFKFADKPGVWFFCQIQMCMKKAGMCDGITPPSCATTGPRESGNEDAGVNSVNSVDDDVYEDEQLDAKNPHGAGDYPETEKAGISRKKKTTRRPKHRQKSDTLPAVSQYGGGGPIAPHRTSPADYDSDQPVTVFGPGIATNGEHGSGSKVLEEEFGPGHEHLFGAKENLIGREHVTTQFETEDDLAPVSRTGGTSSSSATTTSSPSRSSSNRVFADYEHDVTLPPNLTDLLANLPEDVNVDELQRMLRDSVDDRKALIDGFERIMKQMENKESAHSRKLPSTIRRATGRPRITQSQSRPHAMKAWHSLRVRDVPMVEEEEENRVHGPPMIAGQLLIYDLDESPPSHAAQSNEETEAGDRTNLMMSNRNRTSAECVISRQGLLTLATMMGSASAILFAITVVLYWKLSARKKVPQEDGLQSLFPNAACSRRMAPPPNLPLRGDNVGRQTASEATAANRRRRSPS